MKKNIVICSDGTGNTAIKNRGTNVFKIYEAVDYHSHFQDSELRPQISFYDDGVGTDSFKLFKILGGAFGYGLSRNVRELYTALARTYNPGDDIFLFGFSRGAYTVRVLAGFICTCGILDRSKCQSDIELNEKVEEAYRCYRKNYTSPSKTESEDFQHKQRTAAFRKDNAVYDHNAAPDGVPDIKFIGVWDTVDAVGLPFDELADILNMFYRFRFPDNKLNPRVKKACHAIAIDDERRTFHPVMWDDENDTTDRIEQVWFPGVHSNVGGGYPRQGMSLVALSWMMDKAEVAGLRFNEQDKVFVKSRSNPHGKIYDSRAGLAAYYRYKPRDIKKICEDNHTTPLIHFSAIERIVNNTGGYAPGNLPKGSRFIGKTYDSDSIKKIENEIDQAIDSQNSLLDLTKHKILVRRMSQFALVIVTLITLYFTYIHGSSLIEALKALFSIQNLPKDLFKTFKSYPILPIALLISYVSMRVAGKKMHRVFSKFWFDLLS